MRIFRFAAIGLVLAPAVLAGQANPVGDWTAVFVGPIGPRPKMVAAITFSIRSTTAGLTGTAQASEWPGELVVSDIKLEGDRLTFTGTGSKGWSTSYAGIRQDHCCPKLVFAGTIKGDVMTLDLTWTSTEDSPGAPTKPPLPMEAKRISR